MAQVKVRVVGGGIRTMNANSVADIKTELGLEAYGAVVDGAPVADGQRLADGQTVVLATNSKGGC